MPNYEFRADDGEIVTKFYPAKDAPDLGTPIRVNGKRYVRIMSMPLVDEAVARKVHGYPYVSRSLPINAPGCEHVRDGPKKGCCIIESQRQERNVLAREGYTKDFGHLLDKGT